MKVKKIIAFILITGSLVFTILIITDKNEFSYKPVASSPSISQIPQTKKISSNNSNNSPVNSQNIAQEVTPEINTNNENFFLADSEKIIEKYIKETIENFQSQDLKPIISEGELNIINENNSLVLENYFKNTQKIFKNNFAGLNIDFTKLTASNFNKLINTYNETIDQFYKLAVPSNLLTIHKEQIQLLAAQKNIFVYLKNYEEDPLSSILAAQAYQKIEKELAGLKEIILTIIKQYNLNI